MRVSNPRMREIQTEMESADVIRYFHYYNTEGVGRGSIDIEVVLPMSTS